MIKMQFMYNSNVCINWVFMDNQFCDLKDRCPAGDIRKKKQGTKNLRYVLFNNKLIHK